MYFCLSVSHSFKLEHLRFEQKVQSDKQREKQAEWERRNNRSSRQDAMKKRGVEWITQVGEGCIRRKTERELAKGPSNNRRKGTNTERRRRAKSKRQKRRKRRRKRGHLCAAPALLPLLLLQLCVLHSQLEAGQLGHERLVTHMERVRDGELERAETQEKGNDGGRGEKEMRRKKRRAGKKSGESKPQRGVTRRRRRGDTEWRRERRKEAL